MASPSNFYVEQLFDKLNKKIDELKDEFSKYIKIDEFNRRVGILEEEMKSLREKQTDDMKWANEEHHNIHEKIADGFSEMKDAMNRYIYVFIGILVTGIVIPILLHAVFKIF